MKIFDDKAIIERIKLLRLRYAGRRGKSKFARDLGISPSTYNYYENNRVPPIEILLKMCRVTGADLVWLLRGQEHRENFAFVSVQPGRNTAFLRKLDELLRKNPQLAEPISAFIELLCEKKALESEFQTKVIPHSRKNGSSVVQRPGWIPVLGRTAAGIVHFWDNEILPEPKQAVTELNELVERHLGRAIVGSADGTLSIDLKAGPLMDGIKRPQANLIQVSGQDNDEVVEFVECREILELFADSFALRIDGDSMSPRINDGDIVVLSPSVPVAQGQIGVARLANQIGVTCKLFRRTGKQVHLIPINERYETKIVPKKDLLWALAVLCHIRISG
jgi:transcriptional regulator with XRE-family HTH domain